MTTAPLTCLVLHPSGQLHTVTADSQRPSDLGPVRAAVGSDVASVEMLPAPFGLRAWFDEDGRWRTPALRPNPIADQIVEQATGRRWDLVGVVAFTSTDAAGNVLSPTEEQAVKLARLVGELLTAGASA